MKYEENSNMWYLWYLVLNWMTLTKDLRSFTHKYSCWQVSPWTVSNLFCVYLRKIRSKLLMGKIRKFKKIIFLCHMRKYIAELLLNKKLMTDKAVLLGQFKCLKSYEEHFYEGFVMSKYYPTHNFSWQWHSSAHDCELIEPQLALFPY